MNPLTDENATAARDARRPSLFSTWAWFIAKNVIGWLLIVAAFVLSPLPGPGGIPLFLIGFGLVTFPGKRRLTARALRGKPIDRHSRVLRGCAFVAAGILPVAIIGYLLHQKILIDGSLKLAIAGVYVVLAGVLAVAGLQSYLVLNWILRMVAKARRKIRPWLRHHGIDLLPPRRRVRRLHPGHFTREPDSEILEVKDLLRRKWGRVWRAVKPWAKRITTILVTALIFIWMFKPIVRHWDEVKHRLYAIHWSHFFVASAMFAIFLFVFRSTSWRWILRGFGYRLKVAPATRIWSTSELARYLPGMIWQVIGRVYLCKPYGIRGSVVTASQVLELAIFLLANVLVAVSCLVWLGIKSFHGPAQSWLFGAMALVPVLIFLLHPKVLYRIINSVMRKLKKPPIHDGMGFRALSGLLLWAVMGLLWQSLAIWFLVHEPLHLQFTKWWVIAGAYSLAWIAGFLMIFSPGGLGTRELVFMAAMRFALPKPVADQIGDVATQAALLAFLSVLLRLWATAGELMMAGVAYAVDYKGALGRAPIEESLTAHEATAQQLQNPNLQAVVQRSAV